MQALISLTMDNEEGGGGMAMEEGRVEIDTRAPFSSVKEAVMMFGERVLVGEIYGHRFNEMKSDGEKRTESFDRLRPGSMAEELEETMKNLERARQESFEMAYCLSSLREELERTKKELNVLKSKESFDRQDQDDKFMINSDILVSESMPIEKKKKKKKNDNNNDNKKKKKKMKPLIPFIGWIFPKKKKNSQ